METLPQFDQGFADFVKAAFSGTNGYIFIALNLMALVAYRRGHGFLAFVIAAMMASFMGGLLALLEAQARIGTADPVRLMHGVLAGMIISGGSSLIVGYGLVVIAARLNIRPVEQILKPIGSNGGNGPPPPTNKQTPNGK